MRFHTSARSRKNMQMRKVLLAYFHQLHANVLISKNLLQAGVLLLEAQAQDFRGLFGVSFFFSCFSPLFLLIGLAILQIQQAVFIYT